MRDAEALILATLLIYYAPLYRQIIRRHYAAILDAATGADAAPLMIRFNIADAAAFASAATYASSSADKRCRRCRLISLSLMPLMRYFAAITLLRADASC